MLADSCSSRSLSSSDVGSVSSEICDPIPSMVLSGSGDFGFSLVSNVLGRW
ncbi:hypothetical protein HanXRQr2_Chr15g0694161 [Helianthus annuus]|uniref:Uncharacterized protein n=1 Tax=Helianthus annuus TaxID=4232 RepID=A0A9K3E251_HELAN|nr:hypothetical protein HanXRQr2_Chr15g0694161 [Helianthus annuus]KAJ0831352.1 hypothetical protein HanPSC8_Chr15g0666091 [Helianthus annuus]